MIFSVFSKDGILCPMAEAVISLNHIEYCYGFGVYETIRVQQQTPIFLEDHLERLFFSAQMISLAHTWNAESVTAAMSALISAISAIHKDAYNLKIVLIGGADASAATLAIIPSAPYFPDRRWYRDGVKTITVPFERQFPQAKTLNMLASFLAYRRARAADCYDALAIDRDGYIREGTRTNLIGIKDNMLIVQPEEKILLGVTQKKIVMLARERAMEVREQAMTIEDVKSLDAAILTSTSSKIVPIRTIDEYAFPPAPQIVFDLQCWYDECIQSYSAQYL